MPTMTVKGAKELERLLNLLPDRTAKRVTVNGLKAGGRVLVKGMKRRVPVRTGKLRDSITVSSAAKVTKGKSQAAVAFKRPASAVAHLVEFGTGPRYQKKTGKFVGSVPPRPFIRPTVAQDSPEAIKKIGEIMGKGVEREARKLAGK